MNLLERHVRDGIFFFALTLGWNTERVFGIVECAVFDYPDSELRLVRAQLSAKTFKSRCYEKKVIWATRSSKSIKDTRDQNKQTNDENFNESEMAPVHKFIIDPEKGQYLAACSSTVWSRLFVDPRTWFRHRWKLKDGHETS